MSPSTIDVAIVDVEAEETALLILKPRSRRIRIVSIGVVLVASLAVFAPVLGTPYSADDVANSGLSGYLGNHHVTRWHFIAQYVSLWMHHYGRFFPGAVTETVLVFSMLTSRVAYKTFLFLLLALLVFAIGLWVRRSLDDAGAWVVAIAVLTCCWQFRYPRFFDGITSFSGLIPWTLLLMVSAMLLLARRPRQWAPLVLAVGSLLWVISVVTYEVTVLLAPAVIASFWLFSTDRRWRRNAMLAIGLPTLLIIGIDGWLQSQLTGPTLPDFTVRLDPSAVLVTTAKQFVGALPLTQYWVPGSLPPAAHLGWLVIPVALLALLLTWALVQAWKQLRFVDRWRLALLAGIGVWIWVLPSLLTGVTERWQEQVMWGQSYLYVVFETFGIALVAVAALCGLKRVVHAHRRYASAANAVAFVLVVTIAASLSITAGLNFSLL
jgi:hypothetical protein